MAVKTLATDAEIAEARRDVRFLEQEVASSRAVLIRVAARGLEDRVDELAAELTHMRGCLRRTRNLLGDMEAGAGDWAPGD